jgi:hypothetical protein
MRDIHKETLMDARHLPLPSRLVNRVASPRAISLQKKRDRRQHLLAETLKRHGVPALGLLLESLEADFGDVLRVDARLEGLIDADPRAVALFEAARRGDRLIPPGRDPVELREIVFDRRVDHLVRRMGARAVAEFLRKIGQKHMIRTSIDAELGRLVARLTPEMLEATGGDQFPAIPIHIVRHQ